MANGSFRAGFRAGALQGYKNALHNVETALLNSDFKVKDYIIKYIKDALLESDGEPKEF